LLKENNCESCEPKKYAKEILDYYLTLEKELDDSDSAAKNFWKIFVRLLWYPNKQPYRVEKEEADFIGYLRQRDFSMGDIAEIMQRSKSTIQEALTKTS
jgi:SOS response regulatory protein OraA/RecX